VAYSDGTFISVGGVFISGYATNIILSSTNGTDWLTAYSGTAGALNGVTYGSNGWVAVGYNGAILTSSNGLTWNSQNIGATNTLNCVAYGNGIYVALGTSIFYYDGIHSEQSMAYCSTNSINWTGPYTMNAPTAIAYGNNMFVGVGQDGALATSPDGINWTAGSSVIFDDFGGVAFGNGTFAAVCPGFGVVTSSDGTNWISRIGFGGGNAITYGDQGFISPAAFFVTSPDGTNWNFRGFSGPESGVAFGNGTYISVGSQQISQTTPINARAKPLLSGLYNNQGFQLSAISQPNYNYRIQCSSNFLNWQDIFAFTSTQAVTTFTHSDATNYPQEFYRIVSP